MRCPCCGRDATVPRAAFHVPGSYTATCPKGHRFKVETVFRPKEEAPAEAPR